MREPAARDARESPMLQASGFGQSWPAWRAMDVPIERSSDARAAHDGCAPAFTPRGVTSRAPIPMRAQHAGLRYAPVMRTPFIALLAVACVGPTTGDVCPSLAPSASQVASITV